MPHGPYGQGSFEDQFEEFTGQNTVVTYSFEVPFDLVLVRASVGTKSETSALDDAYIAVSKNITTDIVPAGPSGNRTLPVKTNFLKGVDLANINCKKGDKITVCLFVEALNTVKRAKVVLAYCCLLQRLGLPPDYGYGYAGPHP